MGKIKKILENELVGGTQSTDVYPVTSIKAVYDEQNERLDNILKRSNIVNISNNYNEDHILETLTLKEAISKVPSYDRVLGFYGRFLSEEGWNFIAFNGDSLSKWGDTLYWEVLPLYADKNISSLSAALQFKDNIKIGEYYNTSGTVGKDSSNIYRRFPIIPCSSSITLHSLPCKSGAFRTYNKNMEYINGRDVSLSEKSKNGTVVYTFESDVKYIGLYWIKSTDDYSNTYLDTSNGSIYSIHTDINHIDERVSKEENYTKIQETLIEDEVKLNNYWSIGEDVIYNAYYSTSGDFVQDVKGSKYRCLPVLNNKDPFYININGKYGYVIFQNAEGSIINNVNFSNYAPSISPVRIVPPQREKCLLYVV